MFFIIGAPKSGTTALWQYLKSHPQIRMPVDKEAPYFASTKMQNKGWDWYLTEYFSDTNNNITLGSASPQYMSFPESAMNIAERFPSSKIIAVLRDPIERAASHYKMMRNRGIETRTFEEAIDDQLCREKLTLYRQFNYDDVTDNDEINTYVAHSEYKRILSKYYDHFNENQIFIITDKELLHNRVDIFKQILTFIGVDSEYLPSNLQTNFHVGGTRRKRDYLIDVIIKITPLKLVAKALLPESVKKKIAFRLTTRNQKPEDLMISDRTMRLLRVHFTPDVDWLKSKGLNTTLWATTTDMHSVSNDVLTLAE